MRCLINRTAVALIPWLAGGPGSVRGKASGWRLCRCPVRREWDNGSGESGEGLAAPESTQHLFPQGRRGKCFEQVHQREEREGCIFPSLFFMLPALQPLRSGSPASLLPRSGLTVRFRLSVVFSPCLVWPQLSLWLSYPSCLTSTPLGLGPCFSGHRNSAQVLSPVGQIHFPA